KNGERFFRHSSRSVVIPPDHIEINQINIAVLPSPPGRGMTSERMLIGVEASHVLCHLGPRSLAPFGRFFDFTCQNPYHWIGAVARNKIPPVPLDAGDSYVLHCITILPAPGADDRRDHPCIHEMLDSSVRIIEILRINHTEILRFVWLAAF